jgi:hypothetical protein
MSGSEEESTNEASISIAFFLPFFPLEVPLPRPFPVVLLTYNDQGTMVNTHKIFHILLLSADTAQLTAWPTLLQKCSKSLRRQWAIRKSQDRYWKQRKMWTNYAFH